jgi:hypothetical protein
MTIYIYIYTYRLRHIAVKSKPIFMILGFLESLIELIYVYIHLTDRLDPICGVLVI